MREKFSFIPTIFRGTCALLWLVIATTTPGIAQYRASLQGTVTDPQGGAVPGASVTLTSKETNFSKIVTTSSSGVYTIPGLAPGHYSLTVEKEGFAKQVLEDVVITSEQAQSQNVQLQLAQQATTTVTVSAEAAPVIDTESATISGTLTGQQIESLPTFGRDPFQAAELAPGTFGDNARTSNGGGTQNLPGSAGPGGTTSTSSIFQTENQVQIVANGTRNNSNSFQIDGSEVNSLAWGGASVITPNEESIKEVTVQANPYSAENGRNSGAQVLVTSKNGTNDFHGSAVFKAARPGLNAFQRWNGPSGAPVEKNTDRFNQWAASLGGPIVRNHLFFFFSYETLRNASASLTTGWYETPQFLSAVQTAKPGSIAAKIAGYPGEGASFNVIIPKTCADAGLPNPAQCREIFSNGQYAGLDIGSPLRTPLGTSDPTYVSPGTPGVGGGLDGVPDVMFVQSVNPTNNAPEQYNGRIDFQATSRDLIAFSSYYVPNDTTSLNGPARTANLWHSDRLNETATLLWDHTISSTWLNEARGGVTRWFFNEVGTNPQEPWGLPQDKVDNFGATNVNDNYFGAPGPGVFYQTTYNFRDTASSALGKHSLKIGTDLYWEQDNDAQAGAARPTYSFRNLWDFANDAPYAESGNFDPRTGMPTSATKYIRSNIYAVFVQDDYKVKPNLTLNLGLRWEYFTPIHEKYGNISNVLLGSLPDPLLGVRMKVGGDLYNASKNNWGPQFGFAWTPPNSQRFVVRGGFGIGYNRMEEAITLNGRSNPPLVTSLSLSGSSILYSVPSNVHQFYNWPINPAAISTFDPTTGLPITGAPVDLTGFPNNLATPVVYRYSLDTEYNIAGNWVAKLGYQGSLSRHYTIQDNLNWFFPQFLNPRVAQLFFYPNDANASYNALLTEVEHRFSQSFQIDLQYRWSHTIDDGSSDYFIGEYPFGNQYRRGDADFDVRHNVKLYGVWTPAIFKGRGWAEKILGGWQLTGIMNWHTGYPWTPLYGNTGGNVVLPSPYGYTNLRPAGYLGGAGTDYSNSTFMAPNGNFPNGALAYFTVPTFASCSSPGSFPAFNPACVGIPPAPSVGRNTLRGPNYFDTDITVQKSFGLPKLPILGENARFEFRADLFNIFNKLNLAPMTVNSADQMISFDGVTSNPLFGQAQSALAGRIVQLQARFSF